MIRRLNELAYIAALKVDKAAELSETITLEGGQSPAVSFQVAKEKPSSYNVELADCIDIFTVQEAPSIP